MEEMIKRVKKSPLFYGINEEELYTLLKCTGAQSQQFEPGELLFRLGESVDRVMILLRGSALVVQENFWGEREVLFRLKEGGNFGEAYSCARTAVLPVSVEAQEECEALFLNYQRMITFCSLACEFHTRLIHNLLRLVSNENVKLAHKLEHVSRKTTRDKLLSYLSKEAVSQGSRSFDIPYNRQELAEYLGVDRSAMSSELGRLRDQGILEFKKNHFTLMDLQRKD